MLVVDLDSQQFQGERDECAFGIICHASHLPHRGNAPRGNLCPANSDHSLEVSVGQRVVMHRVMQRYA